MCFFKIFFLLLFHCQNDTSKAEEDLRKLLNIGKNYKVLFFQGGGTSQFAIVPLNLLGAKGNSGKPPHQLPD